MNGKRRNSKLLNDVPEYEAPREGASQLSARDTEIMELIGHKRVVLSALRQALADGIDTQPIVWRGERLDVPTIECIRYEEACIVALTAELSK